MFYEVPKANDENTCSVRTLAWIDAILTGTPTSAAVKAACDKDDIDTEGMGTIPYEAFPGITRCGGGSRGNKPVFSEVEHWFDKCGDGAYYLSTVKNDEDIKHAVGLHKWKDDYWFFDPDFGSWDSLSRDELKEVMDSQLPEFELRFMDKYRLK